MLRKGILLLAAWVVAGCSTQYVPVESADEGLLTEPVPVERPIGEILTYPLERLPLPPILPAVAIVLSSSQPAYAEVADELARRLKRYTIYDLSDDEQVPVSVMKVINDSNPGAVVAIGLRAARSTVAMSEKPVVFSQVFNYQDYDLLRQDSRGVAAHAPVDAQLAAWKRIDPALSRIGIIVGNGHDALIAEAREAAEAQGISLRVQITHSDQETLYFFRRMIHDIDGFWLLPDNRVLSPRVLQEILAEAARQDVPVNVPSESMLKLGAMVSMSTVAADIAETIVSIVEQIQAGYLARIPPVTKLSALRVRTNETTQVVRR